jgi:adenine-specific DNA methylase
MKTTGQNDMNQLLSIRSVEEFTSDDYETPDKEAQAIASLVLPTDMKILEPFAGSGQIVKYLPSDRIIDVAELKSSRYMKLVELHNHCFAYNGSFFEFFHGFKFVHDNDYDLIITNPPFSLCMEAISHSLKLLNPDNPTARLLFLIPLDTFASQGRSEKLKSLDAHIHHTHLIPKRIDYLKDGEPMSKCQKTINGIPQFKNGKPIKNSGRQCYDAVFDIRLGKEQATTTFLI